MVFDKQNVPDVNSEDDVPQNQKDGVIVYYFYGDKRCVTCKKLQGYAKEALETSFSQQLALGEVVWMPLNIDLSENKHFVKDYELVTKSVILSKVRNGKEVKWQNLAKIWDKVSDKDDYLSYIKENVTEILKGQG